ncbi:hypothetical protein R1flu_022205 [Riccia fluitans]|uniref:Uncharacterized protein n=1 Tax=Riccia fluitans TaxID=41844 RepID=A0ABD1ZRK1_9MARC
MGPETSVVYIRAGHVSAGGGGGEFSLMFTKFVGLVETRMVGTEEDWVEEGKRGSQVSANGRERQGRVKEWAAGLCFPFPVLPLSFSVCLVLLQLNFEYGSGNLSVS